MLCRFPPPLLLRRPSSPWRSLGRPELIAMLRLMKYAGIENLGYGEAAEMRIFNLNAHFLPSLHPDEASETLMKLLDNSLHAMFPVVFDTLHKVATKLR